MASPPGDAARLLPAILRARWDPPALDEVRAAIERAPVDWDALYDAARAGGVTPLLHAVAWDRDLLPPHVAEAVRLDYLQNRARNMRLYRELERVLRALDAGGVPVLLLKGAALAREVYGNVALRPMGDVDLLVREGDVPGALRLLSALGYDRPSAEFRPGHVLAYRSEVMVARPVEGDLPVEVHWRLVSLPHYRQGLPLDWFWETARPVRVGAAPAAILGPEAQVLHLCAHILQHGGVERVPLLWLHDLGEVAARCGQGIDWARVLARARDYDLLLAVREALRRVRALWDVPLPAAAVEAFQAARPSRAGRRAYALYTTPRRKVRRAWEDLVHMPRGARVRYLWEILFPSASYMRSNYGIPHRTLTVLYYPYRWFRALQRCWR